MTTTELVVALFVAAALFELAEHVVLPVIFALRQGKRRPTTGSEALVGQVVEVRQWAETGGHVFVDGALWKAVSESPLAKGDRAVIRSVDGLTLTVEVTCPHYPHRQESDTQVPPNDPPKGDPSPGKR